MRLLGWIRDTFQFSLISTSHFNLITVLFSFAFTFITIFPDDFYGKFLLFFYSFCVYLNWSSYIQNILIAFLQVFFFTCSVQCQSVNLCIFLKWFWIYILSCFFFFFFCFINNQVFIHRAKIGNILHKNEA